MYVGHTNYYLRAVKLSFRNCTAKNYNRWEIRLVGRVLFSFHGNQEIKASESHKERKKPFVHEKLSFKCAFYFSLFLFFSLFSICHRTSIFRLSFLCLSFLKIQPVAVHLCCFTHTPRFIFFSSDYANCRSRNCSFSGLCIFFLFLSIFFLKNQNFNESRQ